MEFDKFYSFCRMYIPTMQYEEKYKADEYLGKWWAKKHVYRPGSGGQLECHKIIDKLWNEFEKSKQ